MAALHPINNNSYATSSYPHFSRELKYKGIHFPMRLRDISKFEKMNGLSIHVYSIKKVKQGISEIVPLYLSKNNSGKPTIHLLMINKRIRIQINGVNHNSDEDDDKFERIHHSACIKKNSRLISSQLSKHKSKKFLCDRCLCHFQLESSFEKHKQDRFNIIKWKTILPDPEHNILNLKNF